MQSNGALNKVYRVVWNASTGVWQAVSEAGKGQGKSASGRTARRKMKLLWLASLASLAGPSAWAAGPLPTGGQVVGGQGQISQSAGNMVVTQTTDRLAIDWQSFSIGQGNKVNFVQPSAASVALNRVTGSDPSVIQGALTSNGHLFLVNPNGVLFNTTAQVDVGGLTASTLGMSTADFMAGRYVLQGDSAQAVVNQGRISAHEGGTIALVAARIVNDGRIEAPSGRVLLGAGSKVTLDIGGPARIQIEQSALNALIENGGAIQANGGLVYIEARAAGDLMSTVIKQTGTIEARTLSTGQEGQIYLLGDMAKGRIDVGGTLDASAPVGGDGGFIETSAAEVSIRPDIHVSTAATVGKMGDWLIDPYNVVIAATGGHITGATLSTALNSTNVTIDTTNATYGTGGSSSGTAYASTPGSGLGNITVDDDITRTAAGGTTLTLKAHNDIQVNKAITATSGRLNVVLIADQDNSGAGDVNFGATGRVVTNGGNFYVGTVSGTYDETLTATAQNLTMASGSHVDVGTGNLNIAVKGNIALPDNSLEATPYSLKALYNEGVRYFNSGGQYNYYNLNSSYTQFIGLSSANGAITSANANTSTADIVSSVDVRLKAGTIGSGGNALRISGPADPYGLVANGIYSTKTFANTGRTLQITNTAGSSYVDQVGVQSMSRIDVSIGTQANATQNFVIMGDQGGKGHVTLNTDNSGVLAIGTGDVRTGGVPGISGTYTSTPQGTDPSVFPTSLSISAGDITFADNAVDTGSSVSYYYQGNGSYYKQNYGMSSYAASFTAVGASLTSTQVNGTADIKSVTTSLISTDVGTSTAPIELGAGSSLSIDAQGGSSFVKVVDNTFSNVNYTARKGVGEHHVLWSGGDHIDFYADNTGTYLPTILGGASDGSDFTATQGIDLSRGARSLTIGVPSGVLAFDTHAVDLAGGTFNAYVNNGNGDRVSGKSIYGTNAFDGQAEVTAGDVRLDIGNANTSAAAIQDLEFAKGGTRNNNSLAISNYTGDIAVKELTNNHFKSVNLTLNGASVAQDVSVDLAGADDIHFSDSGSLVTIDGTKVNLSANNRDWNLQTTSRKIQVDGTALGTGSYTLYGGLGIQLNNDLLTNGGNISLTAGSTGIVLMKTLRIDSNADDLANSASTGNAGSIYLNGAMSANAAGYSLTLDASSSTTSGSYVQSYSGAGNTGGAYLADLTFHAKGSTSSNDGTVYLYGSSYLLNGNFSAIGSTITQVGALTIDTEQGNVNDAGNVSFSGYSFSPYYWGSLTVNTSTTAAGKNAGNVDLYGTVQHSALSLSSINVTATGGAGGQSGSILLPAISTVQTTTSGTQAYTGRLITLNGNLSTNQSAVTLTGDVQLASSATIDTWSAANSVATGTAGTVTLNGGLGATGTGKALTIDTSTATGNGYANAPTNTQQWAHNGGAVSITGGSTGGTALDALTVTTVKGGTYNTGGNGAITVSGVNTTNAQTYSGGALTFAGDVSASAITVNTLTSGAVVGGTGVITAGTLLLSGTNTIYNLGLGTGHRVGTLAATGAATFGFVNNDVALTVGTVGGVSGVTASGTIGLATHSGDLTLAQAITTTSTASDAVLLIAGGHANAGTATGGDVVFSGTPAITVGNGGRITLMTGSVSGSTGVADFVGGAGSGRFRYGSDETATAYTTPLGSGAYVVYREQPVIGVTLSASKTYDAQAFSGGSGFATSGFVNGDTDAILTGTAVYGGNAQGAVNAGTYAMTVSGVGNSLGYAMDLQAGTLTIDKAALTVTASDAAKTYDGQAFSGGNGLSYSGFASGDNAANSLGGTVAYGGAAQGAVSAGSYALTASGLTSANYDISYTGGSLNVAKAALTVTAIDAAKTYDGQAFSGGNGVSYSGFATGDDAGTSLGGTLAYGGEGQGAVHAGSYSLSTSGLTAANYDISYVNGNLTVEKAALTVTANNAGKTYDGLAFSGGNGVAYTGFVTGDSAAGLDGTLAYGGTSQGAVNAGNYVLSAHGLTSGDYAIGYVDGILKVDSQPVPVVTAITLTQAPQTPITTTTQVHTEAGAGLLPVANPIAPLGRSVDTSGGLVLVGVGSGEGAPPVYTGQAGATGYLKVLVVNGGINLPGPITGESGQQSSTSNQADKP
jgi:filamentous hemagglutinin family protein